MRAQAAQRGRPSNPRGSELGEPKNKCEEEGKSAHEGGHDGSKTTSFLFLHFSKKILQKYIFDFRFYSSIPLPPGTGAVGGLPTGREAVGTYM